MSNEKKYEIALFMIIRNSIVMPKGLELHKSEEEINKMSYATMCETFKMIDFNKAERIYMQGKNAYEEDKQ